MMRFNHRRQHSSRLEVMLEGMFSLRLIETATGLAQPFASSANCTSGVVAPALITTKEKAVVELATQSKHCIAPVLKLVCFNRLTLLVTPKFHRSGKEVCPAEATLFSGKIEFEFPIRERSGQRVCIPVPTKEVRRGHDSDFVGGHRAERPVDCGESARRPERSHRCCITRMPAIYSVMQSN